VSYVVGVIAPYVAQVGRLRSALQSFKKHAVAVHLEINTVDAFQGREVDILLYSLVRVGTGDNPFIGDARRLNVAFSRAKRLLVVIGHRASAETNANLARALRLIPEENFLAVESIK
jgi:superfamily I DNA and/or RNA helicase